MIPWKLKRCEKQLCLNAQSAGKVEWEEGQTAGLTRTANTAGTLAGSTEEKKTIERRNVEI